MIFNEKSTRCRVNLVLTKSNSAVNQSYKVTEKCLQSYWFLSGESNSQQRYTHKHILFVNKVFVFFAITNWYRNFTYPFDLPDRESRIILTSRILPTFAREKN